MSVWLRCCAGSLVRSLIEQKKEIPNTWYLFDVSLGQNLVFKALFGGVSDDKYFLAVIFKGLSNDK